MFGIIKLTIHTITGMWVSIVLFKLMTNGWSGFYFQCCVLSLVFLTGNDSNLLIVFYVQRAFTDKQQIKRKAQSFD